MKQNKRRTATVVYIFIFMLTVSGCVRKGKEQDKVYQETVLPQLSVIIVISHVPQLCFKQLPATSSIHCTFYHF